LLAAEEAGVGVHLHQAAELRQGGRLHAARQQDAGVVDQHVQRTKALLHGVDRHAPGRLVAHVVRHEQRAVAQRGGGLLASGHIDVAEGHPGALFQQQPRRGQAHAAGATRHQRHLALHLSCHHGLLHSVAAARPARRPENTQSANDRPLT
jgi:hypothetical protein